MKAIKNASCRATVSRLIFRTVASILDGVEALTSQHPCSPVFQ